MSLCSNHWDHICKVPRTSSYSRHHLEIALSTPPTFDTEWNNTFDIWTTLFFQVEDVGVSCAIYHKGNLPSMPLTNGMTGMAF